MEIEMKIKGLVVDPISKMHIIVLEDLNSERMLPIWIGVFEANAIALKIENTSDPDLRGSNQFPPPHSCAHHRGRDSSRWCLPPYLQLQSEARCAS